MLLYQKLAQQYLTDQIFKKRMITLNLMIPNEEKNLGQHWLR